MPDRTTLRLGSGSAILGALLALVTNFLHPRLSDYDDPVAEELRVVAESDGWIAIHLGILLATLLIKPKNLSTRASRHGGGWPWAAC